MAAPAVLRILLDHPTEDIFRDIAIAESSNLEELHHAIVQAFALAPGEMASFYHANDQWDQGEEIALEAFAPGTPAMNNTTVGTALTGPGSKLLYVYDFLNMWTFYVERVLTKQTPEETSQPVVLLAVGETPKESPGMNLSAEGEAEDLDLDDDFGDFEDEDLEGLGTWSEEDF